MLKKIKFDDFVRLNRGFDLPDDKIIEGKYPVVTSTNIKAYHNEYKIEPPVVVTGRSGSLGKVQYIQEQCWPLNTALYSKDFKGNNPRYIYYFLQTMHLEQYNAGAGVPTLNQNHLQRLKINVHEIDEQEKVANILAEYDNLIGNNNKRIKLLEQMAENLYKEWFVRFRFPGHETVKFENGILKGWKKSSLGNIPGSFNVVKMLKTVSSADEHHFLMVFFIAQNWHNPTSRLIYQRRLSLLFQGGTTVKKQLKPVRAEKQERRHFDIGRLLFSVFLTATMVGGTSIQAFAATTVWDKANEIMKDVYTQILAISTIAAVVTAAIALLLMNFSKSGRTVDESRAWLKRIIITWAILNSLGFIMAYITPFFAGGKWK